MISGRMQCRICHRNFFVSDVKKEKDIMQDVKDMKRGLPIDHTICDHCRALRRAASIFKSKK